MSISFRSGRGMVVCWRRPVQDCTLIWVWIQCVYQCVLPLSTQLISAVSGERVPNNGRWGFVLNPPVFPFAAVCEPNTAPTLSALLAEYCESPTCDQSVTSWLAEALRLLARLPEPSIPSWSEGHWKVTSRLHENEHGTIMVTTARGWHWHLHSAEEEEQFPSPCSFISSVGKKRRLPNSCGIHNGNDCKKPSLWGQSSATSVRDIIVYFFTATMPLLLALNPAVNFYIAESVAPLINSFWLTKTATRRGTRRALGRGLWKNRIERNGKN